MITLSTLAIVAVCGLLGTTTIGCAVNAAVGAR